jgi:carbon-monoxide dehydrogenase medium subunit
MALDATFVLQGPQGERHVKAVDFFHGTYMTALAEDETLTAILVAPFAAGTGYAYQKLKRKTGDWATAGAAVVLRMTGGVVSHASIGLTNVAPTALRASDAEAALVGKPLSDASIDAAVHAVRAICDPAEDLRGDVEYKTAMAGEMTRRAIRAAAARCA